MSKSWFGGKEKKDKKKAKQLTEENVEKTLGK